MTSAAIVLTTIGIPELLIEYAQNFREHGHKDVFFIAIGDRKTPHEENRRVMQQVRTLGYDAQYWDIEMQERWLKKFPEIAEIVPYNSDNRRNIGYLAAVQAGAEIVVSPDDDNFVGEGDFLGQHFIVGQSVEMTSVTSSNRWFNPCSMLGMKPDYTIYPRGFPFCRRWEDGADGGMDKGRVVLNMGLWTDDPDVDAVTRLNHPFRSSGLKTNPVMLARDTFCPINTQNTAFHRDMLPCYYYVLMGARIQGAPLDRYGDIWSGFFAKKVIDHMGDRATVGTPVARHIRNIHNLLNDLRVELWGMILTDHLAPFLESIGLHGDTYGEAYWDLATQLGQTDLYPDEDVRAYLSRVEHAMKVWVEVCSRL